MSPEILLTYLDHCIQSRNETWAAYVQSRVPEVLAQIDRLRDFANQTPGRVHDLVNHRADDLETRSKSIGDER